MRSALQITRAVIYALVLREFLGRVMKRRMGAVWLLLEPFVHITVLTLFFTYIRGRTIVGMEYPIYLITGLVPFLLFRNNAQRLIDAVSANRGLFAYKQIKPFDAFVARSIVETAIQIAVYGLLLLGFGWAGFDVSVHQPIEWLVVLSLGLLFSFGLGIILAVIVNALPDTRSFISMMFLPLYFISGVVYPPSALSPEYLPLLLWNPFLHIMELTRTFVFEHYTPVAGISFRYVVESTVCSLFIALGIYRVRRMKLLAI